MKFIGYLFFLFGYRVNHLFRRIKSKILKVNKQEKIDYLHKRIIKYPKLESIEKTISDLVEKNMSITRFGDGEYHLCLGKSIGFQEFTFRLGFRMFKILSDSKSESCMIGIIPYQLNGINEYSTDFWYENIDYVLKFFNKNTLYYNARITRELTNENIMHLKKAWEKRDVIFITGKGSRFSENHTIFDNVASKQSLFTTARNAWSDYNQTYKNVLIAAKSISNPIVICAIGPTASILAYDLSIINIQCLDIGHITNIYDKLFLNADKPENLPIQ
ncbi:MAG: DUF1792 domain-containing protein [Flavobacteriales bacterium]|nr:DUF1792 domain-containing protein [Flavobacteriales bacterium]